MPLSPEIAQLINQHLPNEAHASNVYQRLADDVRAVGFEGIGKWLAKNSVEEHGHLQTMMDFLSEYDIRADVPARAGERVIPLEVTDRLNYIHSVLYEVLGLEETVTAQISTIVRRADDCNDWISFQFLMDFIEEQDDSERTLRRLIRILPLYTGNLDSFDALVGAM